MRVWIEVLKAAGFSMGTIAMWFPINLAFQGDGDKALYGAIMGGCGVSLGYFWCHLYGRRA